MFTTLVLFLMLFGTWVVFSGYFGAFFLSLGVISCLIAIIMTQRLGISGCESCRIYYRLSAIPYLFWLIKEILLSSIDVAKRVWQANPNISPTLDWIPSMQDNDVGRTLFANSITLTPGTVAVIVEKDRICVHALCKGGIADLQEGQMDRNVAAITKTGEK